MDAGPTVRVAHFGPGTVSMPFSPACSVAAVITTMIGAAIAVIPITMITGEITIHRVPNGQARGMWTPGRVNNLAPEAATKAPTRKAGRDPPGSAVTARRSSNPCSRVSTVKAAGAASFRAPVEIVATERLVVYHEENNR